ncbi:DUF58 domain-containing protein [Actinomyces mediterranea]|uniref:DUF58 domain-containing protein n=1 Tax=Actinomyces mediterranea TaxID=1871028 RepID=UPI0009702D5D|nr:DUF58 domain-containing protein [Actinomyces mediterranea]
MPVRSRELHALSSRIHLPVMRKLLSVMDGQHAGLRAGKGWEFLDLAEYKAGDDVHAIDWATTARFDKPVVKRYEASANLQMILVVDTGRSMGALAPSGETKEEVSLAACEALAWLSVARGDQIGLVSGDASRVRHMTARSGNAHAETIMRRIEEDITLESPRSDVARLLDRAFVMTRRRSLIVLITDAMQPEPTPATDSLLKRLRARHEVIAISVEDMNPADLPVGTRVIDVDEGPLPDFLLRDSTLASQAHEAVRRRTQAVAEILDRRGVIRVGVGSSAALPHALMEALRRGSRVR